MKISTTDSHGIQMLPISHRVGRHANPFGAQVIRVLSIITRIGTSN